jgi:hypothetical protein
MIDQNGQTRTTVTVPNEQRTGACALVSYRGNQVERPLKEKDHRGIQVQASGASPQPLHQDLC